MQTELHLRQVVPVFLIGLIVALFPPLFLPYISFLFLLSTIFLIICIFDFLIKTNHRKSSGLILLSLILAALVAMLVYYLAEQWNLYRESLL